MSTADCTTWREKPKGFLYNASVLLEPASGANASSGVVIVTLKSEIAIDLMIYKFVGIDEWEY
jgi:hypothetical protein